MTNYIKLDNSKMIDGYKWEENIQLAVNAALAVNRPLLVKGEPGIGKSELAKAAAKELGRAFISETLTARAEPNDLLWQYDGVRRLAEAQVKRNSESSCINVNSELSMEKFISPGILWWAFDYVEARKKFVACPGQCEPHQKQLNHVENGWVVLIDEIDKADSDVPNSLLEAFADCSFQVPYIQKPVSMKGVSPLVIITTNEERELPPAFLRRCLVLKMELPEEETNAIDWLLSRVPDDVGLKNEYLVKAAKIILEDRRNSKGRHKPSLAEFIDFIRGVDKLSNSSEDIDKHLNEIKMFVLSKDKR
ncbi:AAA family ATPase [Maridesulfovibrio sp. FT414]|uniref:AAA family ATPase n=1 Tax=Maridesulfovibrio sp. FT414 TaxID=2979469 RepID=UPI003D805DE1